MPARRELLYCHQTNKHGVYPATGLFESNMGGLLFWRNSQIARLVIPITAEGSGQLYALSRQSSAADKILTTLQYSAYLLVLSWIFF